MPRGKFFFPFFPYKFQASLGLATRGKTHTIQGGRGRLNALMTLKRWNSILI